jgi:hypothetical protein
MEKYSYYERLVPELVIVKPIKKYYGYKAGKGEEFNTLEEAKTYSKINEIVVINEEEIKQYRVALRERDDLIYNKWLLALRENNISASKYGIFDDCFNYMYQHSNASSRDEIAEEVSTLCDFVVELYERDGKSYKL